MQLAILILGLIQAIVKIFGPSVAKYAEAEVEKFRAKHPDEPNVTALIDRAKALTLQVVREIQSHDWSQVIPEEVNDAKHRVALVELLGDPTNQAMIGRLAEAGLNLNKDDVDQLIKGAVDVVNFTSGGRKAPAQPLAAVAVAPAGGAS